MEFTRQQEIPRKQDGPAPGKFGGRGGTRTCGNVELAVVAIRGGPRRFRVRSLSGGPRCGVFFCRLRDRLHCWPLRNGAVLEWFLRNARRLCRALCAQLVAATLRRLRPFFDNDRDCRRVIDHSCDGERGRQTLNPASRLAPSAPN